MDVIKNPTLEFYRRFVEWQVEAYVRLRECAQKEGGEKTRKVEEEKEKAEERFIYARGYKEALRLRSHDDDDRARRHEFASFTRS